MSIQNRIDLLRNVTQGFSLPMSVSIAQTYPQNPFPVLISCLLSLRCKDTVTHPVSLRLFKKATTPKQLLQIPLPELEQIIYSINYYKKKAKLLHEVSQIILDRFDGNVPSSLQDLLSIKGVGLKTANLVRAEAFGIPAICVDVHVHRLSNIWNIVSTKTPEQTEAVLQKIIPQKNWIEWSRLLVIVGQNICKPRAKSCALCINHDEGC